MAESPAYEDVMTPFLDEVRLFQHVTTLKMPWIPKSLVRAYNSPI